MAVNLFRAMYGFRLAEAIARPRQNSVQTPPFKGVFVVLTRAEPTHCVPRPATTAKRRVV
eukprot:9518992-Lingulodinium_polyedra.AAC.1